jgi:hypothetical protein
MLRLIMTALVLATVTTAPARATEYCDRFKFGSPEWWNCTAQDRETGS